MCSNIRSSSSPQSPERDISKFKARYLLIRNFLVRLARKGYCFLAYFSLESQKNKWYSLVIGDNTSEFVCGDFAGLVSSKQRQILSGIYIRLDSSFEQPDLFKGAFALSTIHYVQTNRCKCSRFRDVKLRVQVQAVHGKW